MKTTNEWRPFEMTWGTFEVVARKGNTMKVRTPEGVMLDVKNISGNRPLCRAA